jgi:hypothetical protein
MMKMFLWVVLGFGVAGIALWMITASEIPRNPLLVVLLVAVFAAAPVGTFWMLYVAIRHEKHPLSIVLLAFIPYVSLWYYFERVRPGKHIRAGL